MAHISDCMVVSSMSSYNPISRGVSPKTSQEKISAENFAQDMEKEKFVWRLHQPTEGRKYQFFPGHDKLSITPGLTRRSPDPEQSGNLADRPVLGSASRLKAKEQSLARRRKPSVSDLGPMTTVQEISMDSPTIPGRPPLHERSISAPGNTGHPHWRRNVFGGSAAIDETAENALVGSQRRNSDTPQTPMSPKDLAPLVIPLRVTSPPQQINAVDPIVARLRVGSDPAPDVPPKSARMLVERGSPQSAQSISQYTPITASSTNQSISTLLTPISAFGQRVSPLSAGVKSRGSSPATGHTRGQSDASTYMTERAMCHRRGESEASLMERGRSKKRDGCAVIRTLSIASQQAQQKAFETLPQGIRASEASCNFDKDEIEALKRQAIGQASRFEVLASRDVDSLSRELRALDERCEYLRKTHRSLRSGRRNLHDRICSYLRSPRVARFSHESLLKQEEALSELDQSIDDWVTKLEQAENRQTRVRQKLLEHVAAALTLDTKDNEIENDNAKGGMFEVIRSMGQETPPRSPIKMSPSPSLSPQRLAQPVATSMAPVMNRPQSLHRSHSLTSDAGRPSAESIRIYADSDIYALLADVEEEFNRMGNKEEILSAVSFTPPPSAPFKKETRSASPFQRIAAVFVS